jgi:4-aminobutyrate aminotransferase/(S)-3-amino-2-methylpropionate transaminase
MASALRSSLNFRPAARFHTARTFGTAPIRSAAQPFFANEPKAPSVQTAIPGPKNQAATKELNEVFDVRSLNHLADYSQSIGN